MMKQLDIARIGYRRDLPVIELDEVEGYSLAGAQVTFRARLVDRDELFVIEKSEGSDGFSFEVNEDGVGELAVTLLEADWADLPECLRRDSFSMRVEVDVTLATGEGPLAPFRSYVLSVLPR